MATVNFLYRSTKDKANLVLRLLYRHNSKDYVFGTNTKVEVTKFYWAKQHKLKRVKDIEVINKQNEVKKYLSKLENYILRSFNSTNTESINKEWLKKQVEFYYNPPKQAKELPIDLINYFDSYINFKRNDITKNTIKKCNVIKQLVIRYQKNTNKPLLISDINTQFKTDFEEYCLSENYAPNTISVSFKFIKTICNHAKLRGIKISPELKNVKSKYYKVPSIFLTFDELGIIEKKTNLAEYLINAKDWLIISCYTGQRVSDFMRFNKEMIRYEKNKDGVLKPLIEFTQQKTGKIMTVPLHKKVINILKKRSGDFPHPISDQKYNEFIKVVCEKAGLTYKIKGSKKVKTKPDSKIYRKVTKLFEKWELVTSHIGRRSFATNFYGTIPTIYLINVTGHSTEEMFLNYIGKSNKDLAIELSRYF